MRTRLVRIGNSQGIRIPKFVLDQVGLAGELELTVHADSLVLAPVRTARADWAGAFRAMARRGDDTLVDGDVQALSMWDKEGWKWR